MDSNVFCRFCFKCGERIPPNYNHCVMCGADQSDIEKLSASELCALAQKYEPTIREFEQAAYFYGLASEKGDREAPRKLAIYFEQGWGVNPSQEKAEYYANLYKTRNSFS